MSNHRHCCDQLQRYNDNTRKSRYDVSVRVVDVEIVQEVGKWYRVEGARKTPVGRCTFCGKKL